MQTALDLFRFESRLFKNRIIRKEIHRRPGLSRLSDLRQQSVFQFNDRDSSLIPIMMNISITADLYIHVSGKCIYD